MNNVFGADFNADPSHPPSFPHPSFYGLCLKVGRVPFAHVITHPFPESLTISLSLSLFSDDFIAYPLVIPGCYPSTS